jgi:hypothetical protein
MLSWLLNFQPRNPASKRVPMFSLTHYLNPLKHWYPPAVLQCHIVDRHMKFILGQTKCKENAAWAKPSESSPHQYANWGIIKTCFHKTTHRIRTPPSSSLINFLNLWTDLNTVYNQSGCANEYKVSQPKMYEGDIVPTKNRRYDWELKTSSSLDNSTLS